MKSVLKEALKDIKPTPAEEKAAAKRIGEVVARVQKLVPEAKGVLGGSGEKGTWLKQSHDADIFVQFPKGREAISDLLERKISRAFKLQRLHGSRDYFQTRLGDFVFEIIPIISIKKAEEAENITDVSPLHAKWVKKYAKLADDIRLAKQFFKAAGAYGAESHISGFSGYICEVLTIYYGGFAGLAKGLASWKPKTIIDVAGAHKGKNVLFELDRSKTVGPLIVIDPVQPSRNAAAAVSEEKYLRIIDHAKRFLKRPSKDFFTIRRLDKTELKKRAGKDELFFLEAVPLPGKPDVVGCKLLKVHEFFVQQLGARGFAVRESGWDWGEKARYYYILKGGNIPPEIVVRGPPARMKKHAERFRKAHRETFEKNGTWYAKEKREFTDARTLMAALIKDPRVSERVRKIIL